MKLPEEPKFEIQITPRRKGRRVATHDETPSMTQQHFKDQCDVNKIIAKYKKTGEITHLAKTPAMYKDLSNVPTYQEALDTVLRADQAFANLPARMREKFQNQPAKLLEFLEDPKNKEEGIKLGIYQPEPQINQPNEPIQTPPPTPPPKTDEPKK